MRIGSVFLIFVFLSFAAFPVMAQNFGKLDAEINDAVRQAEAALKICDEDSYEEAIDWLDEIADDVGGDIADDIDDTIDGLDTRWNSTYPCGLKPRDNPYALNLQGAIGRLIISRQQAYLGKENGGVINTLRFVEPDDSGTYTSVGGEFRYNFGPFSNIANFANLANMGKRKRSGLWDFFFGLNHSRSVLDDSFTDIGTGGDVLLVPGVGSGPNGAGFSLAFAGGANTITSATYDSEYDWDRYWLGFGKTINRNGVRVRTFGGLEYGRLDARQRFGGSIPGFARDFEYNTSVTSDIYSPFAGIDAAYRPEWSGLPVTAELFGKASYKLGYNRADGWDSLDFTGFNNQTIDLDENEFTHNLGFEGGITFNPDKPWSYSIGGGYQRMGNMPVVTRDGQGPSNLKFENSDVWTAGIRATYKF